MVIILAVVFTAKLTTGFYGILISTLLVFYEIAFGQLMLIESSGGNPNSVWPPIYMLSVILFTFFGYLLGRIITYFINEF